MDSSSFFNSPVIQRNTPIKRIGLSRKRKSSGSVGRFNSGVQTSSEKSPRLDVKNRGGSKHEVENDNTIEHFLNYEKELEVLKAKISEKEERLRTLQNNNKNIVELENLVSLWKTGCKTAYLEFFQILKSMDPSIKTKDVLTKLGIWQTMVENFEHDSDISLSLDCIQ